MRLLPVWYHERRLNKRYKLTLLFRVLNTDLTKARRYAIFSSPLPLSADGAILG